MKDRNKPMNLAGAPANESILLPGILFDLTKPSHMTSFIYHEYNKMINE